jgi:hypothetical protein
VHDETPILVSSPTARIGASSTKSNAS